MSGTNFFLSKSNNFPLEVREGFKQKVNGTEGGWVFKKSDIFH